MSRRCSVKSSLPAAAILLASALVFPSSAGAQPPVSPQAAGEFGLARQQLGELPAVPRARGLQALATQQVHAGDTLGAARSMSGMSDPAAHGEVLGAGAAGGGAMADFGTLMQLIQTTVNPDGWEALGGPSTMFPYPQGVYVDPAGLVHDVTVATETLRIEDIQRLLQRSEAPLTGDRDWQTAAPRRCVSLRRLADEWLRLRATGQPIGAALWNVGGLTAVDYVLLDPDHRDVVLVGSCGGIEWRDGWPTDRVTGRVPLQLPMLVAVMQAVAQQRPFGCTIDPTNEGLAAALQVARGVQTDTVPLGAAAERMEQALGRQNVSVFGTPGDTALACLMVAADRHMKRLALEQEPLPEGVPSYLDAIEAAIADGPPQGQLLRLWFTAQPMHVQTDASRRVFRIHGRPVRLASQDQRPDAAGGRHQAAIDPRSVAFTRSFNRNFESIGRRHPIYFALEQVYRIAGIAELLRRHGSEVDFDALVAALAPESLSGLPTGPIPRQVESIAVMHTIKHRRQRHHVIVASGGVSVRLADAVPAADRYESYDSLASLDRAATIPPADQLAWWWNRPAEAPARPPRRVDE